MANRNFLSAFIKEDIYLFDQIKDQQAAPIPKKYLVITPEPLTGEDQKFLYKVFSAVQIAPESIELSVKALGPENYTATFYFGAEPESISSSYYQKQMVQQKPLVVAHSLAEIASDNNKKRKLWTVLKSLFNQNFL